MIRIIISLSLVYVISSETAYKSLSGGEVNQVAQRNHRVRHSINQEIGKDSWLIAIEDRFIDSSQRVARREAGNKRGKSIAEAGKTGLKSGGKRRRQRKGASKSIGRRKGGVRGRNRNKAGGQRRQSTSDRKQRANAKRRKNRKGKSGSRKKVRSGSSIRLTGSTCNLTCVIAPLKKYLLYSNQARKNKRISAFVKLGQAKKVKAASAFNQSAQVVMAQTMDGKECNGGKPDTDVEEHVADLSDCHNTAQTQCDIALDSTESSLVDDCAGPLDTFVTDFEACIRAATPACACFDALTLAPTKCEDHDKVLTRVKDAKTSCLDPNSKGSFSYCRQRQVDVGTIINKCNPPPSPPPTLTTKAPAFRRNIFQLFQKRN